MRHKVAALVALVVLAAHAVYTVRHLGELRLLRLETRREMHLAAALPDLFRARLVFVGELHNQPSHHEAQLRVIRAFHEADRPVAVGLEMFRADSQHFLDRWTAGELSVPEFLHVYYDNWTFPWTLYRDIFTYAREHGIPLVGLNVHQEVIRQVARGGFASLRPEQARELAPVRCEVDADYEAFIRRALGMEGHGGRTFTYFCEAQLVWDTTMASTLLGFLEGKPSHTVVVVAGSGHAWKRGIPEQVSRVRPVPTRVIVPAIPERVGGATVGPEDADYLWLGLPLR